MSGRKLLGIALLASPFVGLAVIVFASLGVIGVITVFGAAALISAVICLGMHLVVSEPQ